MKSQFVKSMINEIPEDIKLFSSIYAELTLRINEALKAQGLTQKELAVRLEKRPSEISKWLSGEHNFTLRSLCKLQCELGVELIKVPDSKELTSLINEDFVPKETLKWKSRVYKKPLGKEIPLNVSFNNQYTALANY